MVQKITFGNYIKEARKDKEWTMQELVEECGKDENGDWAITDGYLSKLENGIRNNPSIEILCTLIKVLSLDVKTVFRCFGYEELIESSEQPVEIKALLRGNEIDAPLVINDAGRQNVVLTDTEKNYIEEIFKLIFEYGASASEISGNLAQIISLIEKYRISRQKEAERRFGFIRTICMADVQLEILVTDKVLEKMKKMDIVPNDLVQALMKMDKNLLYIQGDFPVYIINDMHEYLVICTKDEQHIAVSLILDTIRQEKLVENLKNWYPNRVISNSIKTDENLYNCVERLAREQNISAQLLLEKWGFILEKELLSEAEQQSEGPNKDCPDIEQNNESKPKEEEAGYEYIKEVKGKNHRKSIIRDLRRRVQKSYPNGIVGDIETEFPLLYEALEDFASSNKLTIIQLLYALGFKLSISHHKPPQNT